MRKLTTSVMRGTLAHSAAYFAVVASVAFGLAACGNSDSAAGRPNILLIVADDLGYSDLGAFGSEISTPNLDALATEGRLLLNHHTSTSCAPTRATLHAGTDQHLTGIGSQSIASYQRGKPGYEGYLNERSLYMAEVLRDGGYHTYIAGKWHLGNEENQAPPARGYEKSYVLLPGVANHFGSRADNPLPNNNGPYRENGATVTPPANFFSTEFYTDKLIEYIRSNLEDGKPFFAFAAYTAPHWPIQATDEYIDRYRGRYDVGYEAIRAARFQRQKALGIVRADLEYQPSANVPKGMSVYSPGGLASSQANLPHWDELTAEQRADEARRMEVYAAMVEQLDANIGRLISYLKQVGVYNNTLIVFHSDNGAEMSGGGTDTGGGLVGAGGYDNSFANIGRYGSYVYIGQGWAEVSSSPHRYYKGFPSEGGHRVPTIVRLPGQHSARAPLLTLTTIEDWLPTFIDLANIPNPGSSYQGRDVNPITGYSLLSLLQDRSATVREETTVWAGEQFNRRYLYKGDWKIAYFEAPLGKTQWELYNIVDDRSEASDLSAARPDKLAELVTDWDVYVQRFGVVLPPEDTTQ